MKTFTRRRPRDAAPAGRRRPRPVCASSWHGRAAEGPRVCPMCGEAVGDLRRHVRERHDDAASHPRE